MVEKDITKSISSIRIREVREITSVKKKITKKDLLEFKSNDQRLLCNFYSFNFKNKNLIIRLYSSKIVGFQDMNEKDNLFKLKKILHCKQMKEFLNKIFSYFYIANNNIYAITESDLKEIYCVSILQEKEGIIVLDSSENKENLDDKNILNLEINLKKEFKDNIYSNREDSRYYLHFLNIFVKKLLKEMNYVQSDPLQKSIYYNKNKGKIYTDSTGVYFTSGYKINLNYYDSNILLLKCVQKFRLLRDMTFYDLYKKIKRKENFRNLVMNKKGVTTYSFRTWRIDDVDFEKTPNSETIVQDNGKKINMRTYYEEKYKVIIRDPDQPLLVHNDKRKNPEGGEKTFKKYYLVPELLLIVGKLDENENYSKFTIIPPSEKYISTGKVVEDLSKTKDKALGQPEINNIELMSYIIMQPEILFAKKNAKKVNDSGVFNIDESCLPIADPKDNKIEKNKWILIIIDEVKQKSKDVWGILSKTNYFKDYFENPEFLTLKYTKMLDDKYYMSYFKQELENLQKKLNPEEEVEPKKKKKPKNFKIALVLNPLDFKDKRYSGMKKVLYQLEIPSQFILIENFLKKAEKNIKPVATKIFFSMLSKIGIDIYHPTIIEKKIQKATMVCGYSNAKLSNNKMVTCLSATQDYKLLIPIFLTDYQEDNSAGISLTIPNLMVKALKNYYDINEEYPVNIVIYRECVTPNLRYLILEKELEEIKSKIKESLNLNIKIIFIFVNKQTDLRLFYRNLSDQQIENVPVGTLVESTITSNEYWEFILNSTCPRQGTARPTNYIIGYDNTDLSAIFIYKLTYYLTFCYHNNNCSVRLPAHLMNTLRHANFISKNLIDVCKMHRYSNHAL